MNTRENARSISDVAADIRLFQPAKYPKTVCTAGWVFVNLALNALSTHTTGQYPSLSLLFQSTCLFATFGFVIGALTECYHSEELQVPQRRF